MMQSLFTLPLPQRRHRTPLLPQPSYTHVGLSRSARVNGLTCIAPRGHGKSRFLGRQVCFHDALNRIGSVVIDVVGGTINNALDKLLYLPEDEQLEVGERLRYCNMSGEAVGDTTYVSAWPLLTKRFPNERLFITSQRPLELIRKTDRNLATASIQGLNRLSPLLTSVAIVLAALGEPLSRAYDLLSGTRDWQQRLTNLAFANLEAAEACLYLLRFFALSGKTQEERTEVLRNKLFYLKVDPVSQALFSAREPMIDWEEVAHKGLQVYIDLSGNDPDAVKELKIMWVFSSLMEYVKSRGSKGHEYPPLSVVIDELSYFVRGTTLHTDVISEDFREFAEVRSRNANIYLTVATQDLKQLPEQMQAAVLSMGNLLFGTVKDYETAIELAKCLCPKDPKLVKDWHIQYAIERGVQGQFLRAIEIDRQAVYYPLAEQDFMNSRFFTDLTRGEWLLFATSGEGESTGALQTITTKHVDRGMYDSQNTHLITRLKGYLMERDGIPVSQTLGELDTAALQPGPLEADDSELPDLLPESNGRCDKPIQRPKPLRRLQD